MKYFSNININISSFFTLVILISFLTGCQKDSLQTLPERSWELVWSDEFDSTSGTLPDPSKWQYDLGTGASGWGNNELQYYTDRVDNVAQDGNGNLIITAKKENYSGSAFTSARIKTKGLFSQTYGRVEARIKTPYGPGIWPAFWMLGNNIDSISWPNCGEIDIMEMKGHQPNIIYGTVHGPGYSGGSSITKSYAIQNQRFDADFHLYAIEWQKDQIDFFVDDFLYERITPNDVKGKWVFNNPFYIIMNLAIGGNFVGYPTESTFFPQKMTIDYVKVYKSI
ncbi:MAG: glycoside hydrolase family 16 protein [Saprospiraceae bacterium]|nr:glycoside hydrolase family 16 protein [Saprospiraceae bacterium]